METGNVHHNTSDITPKTGGISKSGLDTNKAKCQSNFRRCDVQFKHYFLSYFMTLIYALMLSCSSITSPEWAAVKTYYQYINNGEYAKAKEIYTEAPIVIGGMQIGEGALIKPSPGTIKELILLHSPETTGQKATVRYKIVYKNGHVMLWSAELKKENGFWKIELIRPWFPPDPFRYL